jgi:hypothetical protein
MLGGGHVRRRSVIDASPCPRMGKRKHAAFEEVDPIPPSFLAYDKSFHSSPNKARIIEKPSIASTSSFKFGGERMISAKRGLLERQSLEDSCLVAEGEDSTGSCMCHILWVGIITDVLLAGHVVPVFTRPAPSSRPRSSTCTSSSGADTPPHFL